jgi:hypothetical protein
LREPMTGAMRGINEFWLTSHVPRYTSHIGHDGGTFISPFFLLVCSTTIVNNAVVVIISDSTQMDVQAEL